MKITKFEHAHLLVEVGAQRLIIDPGSFSADVDADGIDVVVITHAHADHWTAEHLVKIRDASPDVAVLGPAAVAEAAGEGIQVVAPGDEISVGGIRLRFVGGEHEPIHADLVRAGTNVGVVVNDTLYHPGDSFTMPGQKIVALAAPIGGPWHSLARSIDLVRAVGAAMVFNLHDAVLSSAGVAMSASILGPLTKAAGGEYTTLRIGDSLTVETERSGS